ncbi:MAG: hypothetical protein MUP69_10215 [Candidatus Atribacteria bacterium]|nr:hypothetical protein [Candidatus Atribacteria bacterium]
MYPDSEMCVKNSVTIPTIYSTGSTVDADSAAAQMVLNVLATGAFTAGDRVIVNRVGVRKEEGIIDSVQAGVSITLLANLTYAHTALQADIVEVCMASLSEVIEKAHYQNLAIFLPAGWTAAVISLTGCDTSNGTFNKIVDSVAAAEVVTASMAASLVVTFSVANRDAIAAVPYIQLRSGTLAAPVDQGAGDVEISYVLTR